MTRTSLPEDIHVFMSWDWSQLEPHYRHLQSQSLDQGRLPDWLAEWTELAERISETYTRLAVATTLDTADREAEARYHRFLEEIFPATQAAEQALKEKLLSSGLTVEGFDIPLKNMQAEAALFREANLPLLTQEQKLGNEYDKVVGAHTVDWGGQELTVEQLKPLYQDPDRDVRESAWRLAMDRWLQDREAINDLWVRFMDVRRQLAANAGQEDFRAFRWQQLLRFDYSPQDCQRFQDAIEAVVVPAARRVYERRRQRLGLKTLRPWDIDVDPRGRPPLRPYRDVQELETRGAQVFMQVDPQLGMYFNTMRQERLLDLENRKGKAPGAYCADLALQRRPFIFMNAVGVHDDVQTLLHESGHAFHVFESAHLPYHQQWEVGAEMAEVASMSIELLAGPFLTAGQGGYYSEEEAGRARVEHLEGILMFWPYMAVVDAFQHWVYTHHDQASDPQRCDEHWARLWDRFIVGEDWSGLLDEKQTGWHRKLHIHQIPFYYVEYGLAQLGAAQVWGNSLDDQARAVARYRQALSLGGTRSLPELYQAAGAHLAFDAGTLGEAVALIETTIEALDNY